MGKHFKKQEKETKKNIITILMLIAFSTLLVISSVEIIKWYKSNKENEKIQEEISEAITIKENEDGDKKSEQDNSKYNVDFNKLKQQNEDTVGWLKVEGTDVEYVVVQSTNNKYYLDRNFEQKFNSAGWIYADYRNKLDGKDKNIVIYGHNRRDGSMFGTLKNILKKDWYSKEENRKVTFITEKEEAIYEVFSVYKIEVEDYYIKTSFKNKEFSEFIKKIKQRSVKDFDVKVTEKDSILTLSTCANDNKYRVVLHAKKIKWLFLIFF